MMGTVGTSFSSTCTTYWCLIIPLQWMTLPRILSSMLLLLLALPALQHSLCFINIYHATLKLAPCTCSCQHNKTSPAVTSFHTTIILSCMHGGGEGVLGFDGSFYCTLPSPLKLWQHCTLMHYLIYLACMKDALMGVMQLMRH